MRNAKRSEIVQIRSPIKKEIKHLGGSDQHSFSELLEQIANKMNKWGYKLIHVTKAFRDGDKTCSESYWKRDKIRGDIKIVWLCSLRLVFDKGFKFELDFDVWFEFSKLLQETREKIYRDGFPYTSRPYAENFGKEETTRILEKIRNSVRRVLREKCDGWGEHGVIDNVTDRKSQAICHLKKIGLSSFPEFDKLRETLREVEEIPTSVLGNSREDILEIVDKKKCELIPFSIDSQSLEGFLAFFLWFRSPGGGLEYQLYRFVQENWNDLVKLSRIEEALLRLEVYDYVKVEEVPYDLRKELEKRGIKRCKRFYELKNHDVLNRRFFSDTKRKARLGAYLSPLPKKRLVRHLNAPNHIVLKNIRNLVRRNYLLEKKVRDFSGRTVRKIKPKRGFGSLSELDREIMKKSKNFYEVQKDLLDKMQGVSY